MNKKILWIEDDALLASILGKILREHGYDLTHVKNAEEALETLRQFRPNVIIVDILMPGEMNGFDVLKAIYNDPELKKIPRIVLSNLSRTSDLDLAKGLGVSKFLVKANSSIQDITKEIDAELAK